MTVTGAAPEARLPEAAPLHDEAERWDGAALASGGHLLQSWRWGEFKQRHGWRVERVRAADGGGVAQAQVLFRHRGPLSVGYLPRGPMFSHPTAGSAQRLFAEVDAVCRGHRALSLIIEPNEPLPLKGRYRAHGFVRGPAQVQPARSVIVPLLDDGPLLDQMHQKTRYNIRLAQRRGVKAAKAPATAENVTVFYDLLRDTAGRNEFGIHSADYYEDFLSIFGGDAALMFAWIEGQPVAGLVAARFGELAVYMYGASSTKLRAHGAGFFLQFEAMRWARGVGCRRYDLWGIPEHDPASTEVDEGSRVAGTRGEDWRGLYEFKVRFGGQIVTFPASLERRYVPVIPALARRVTQLGG